MLINFISVLFLLTGCSPIPTTTEGQLTWPNELHHFPTWTELNGKINEVENRADQTDPSIEINYYITVKINGDVSLVTTYIERCINEGWTMTEQEGVWTTDFENVNTELEIPCTMLDGWGGCAGEYSYINIFTSTSSLYISVILGWVDNSKI